MEKLKTKILRSNSTPLLSSPRWQLTQGFLQDTSLHGLRYLAHKDTSRYEKVFWALVFIAGLSISIYFVTEVYATWQANPIVMTVESTNEPIKRVKFPAVTLCPTQQILLRKANQFYENLSLAGNLSITNQQMITALKQGLQFDESEPKSDKVHYAFEELAAFFETLKVPYAEAMNFVAPTCDDMIIDCTWKNGHSCISEMRTILTPMGSCCAFNFPNFTADDTESCNTAYKGKGFGLHLLISPQNNDQGNNTFMQNLGHQVLVHDHFTYPYRPSLEMHVGPGEMLNVAVQPTIIESENGLQSVSQARRDCSFGDEYQLGLKLPQTYHNCLLDCFHKYQLAKCNCVQGYIQTFNPQARICGLRDLACLHDILTEVMENLEDTCHCQPPCEETIYNTENTLRNMTFLDITRQLFDSDHTSLQNHALIHVFFKESRFTKYKRNLRYHWEDFIAAAGGLLGVGVGFSLLSAVEVIYFFCYKCLKSGSRPKTGILPMYETPPLKTWTILPDNFHKQPIFLSPVASQTLVALLYHHNT